MKYKALAIVTACLSVAPAFAQSITLAPGQSVTIQAADPPPITVTYSGNPPPTITLTTPIRVFGDSIALASTIDPALGFVATVGNDLHCSMDNRAITGTMALDASPLVYTLTPAAVTLYEFGTNDERLVWADVGKLQAMADAQSAQFAWMAIPESQKRRASDAAFTYTGSSWAPTPALWQMGMRATTTGDTAMVQVGGSILYLGFIQDDASPSTATVAVDGVWRADVTTKPASIMQTTAGSTYAAKLVRVGGLINTVHTVTVQVTSNNAGWPVYLDWVAGLDGTPANGPIVVATTTIPSITSYPIGGSLLGVRAVNAYLAASVRQLAADGLSVRLADTFTGFSVTTDLSSDGVHPNNAGHRKIATAIERVLGDIVCP